MGRVNVMWFALVLGVTFGMGAGSAARADSETARDGAPAALVAVVRAASGAAAEDSVSDELNAVMIRNATKGRYDERELLVGPDALSSRFLDAIAERLRRGFTVDVLVLAPASEGRLTLADGAVDEAELGSRLLVKGASGRLGFVYLDTSGAAPVWNALGARTVLTHPQGSPLYFPRLLSHLAGGASVRAAAREARAAGAEVLRTLDPASGDERVHSALAETLIRLMGRIVAPGAPVEPRRIPSIEELAGQLDEAVEGAAGGVFPGPQPGGLSIPGTDVRVILRRVLPDFENYMQEIVDHLDSLDVKRGKARLLVDAVFENKKLRLKIQDKAKVKNGQLYAVDVGRRVHFEISMKKDSILIGRISGIKAQIKLPVVPNGVTPRSLFLDAATEKLKVTVAAVGGVLKVVGEADVRARKFTGVDWAATLSKNWPLMIGALIFF